MKLQKYLAILLALALLLCLLPATALAEDPEEPPTEPVETDAPGEEPKEPEPSQEPVIPEEPKESEPPKQENPAPAKEPEEEEEEEEEEDGPFVNEAEEVCYPEEGETVYNNGGTVYNNGALVYNNGGLVYQNGGTVYNNGGVVYANGGTVYNNGGTVYRNDALVYTFDDDVQDSHIYGSFRVEFEADYSAFALVEGLTDEAFLNQGDKLVITPLEGWILSDAEADAGVFTENEDGSWTLSEVDGDVSLRLSFRPEAPVFDLEEGTYAEEQILTITAPEGTEIYYTTDGSEPGEENGQLYEEPLILTEGAVITAVALAEGAEPSEPTAAAYAFVLITAPELEDGKEGEDPPKAAAFKLENPGDVDADIESVKLEGKNADCFKLNTGKAGTVKAGKTDEKTWTIRPVKDLKKGSYIATAVFTLSSGETVELKVSFKVK
jgi:methionine-rich copper-binding protein CopC